MATLPTTAWHEVAAWIQHWQPDRQVVADLARKQILITHSAGVLSYGIDAVERLVLTRGTR